MVTITTVSYTHLDVYKRQSYCWNRPMDLVDLNGKFPSWRDLKKVWNKYIYGEETIGSSTNTVVTGKNWGIGTDVYKRQK